MKNDDEQSGLILAVIGIIPVIWFALLVAPYLSSGLMGILDGVPEAMNHPFSIRLCGDSVKTVLIFLLSYGMGIGIYISTKKHYRRGEEHGSAKWGNVKKINRRYREKRFTKNKLLTMHVRISYNMRKHMRNLLTVVIGGSGSGKTRFFAKVNLLQANTSFVVLDPKGENLRDTGYLLEEKGYEVRVLDLINMEKSHCYNPFVYLKDDNDVQRLVTNLFKATTPKGSQSNDPFWDTAASMLLLALIFFLRYEAPEEEQNFSTLLEFINASETREDDEEFKNAVDELFEELEAENLEHFAVRQYRKYKLAAGKTAKSILISCGARLAPFDIQELREIMSYDEMELDMIGDQKTAMFVIISDTDDTFNFVVAIMYTQLFNLLCDKADDEHGGRLPYHVRLLLDEFSNIGQIPKFDKLIATIRSREISASIILQSQSQLKTIYKDAAETITGNCDTVLFLGGKESSTLKEISETLGKETIDLYNTSDTRGTSQSYGLNYQKTGKELMSRDELAVMDGNKCILQLRGVRPFLSNKYDITKHKRYKELSDANKRNAFDVEKYLEHKLVFSQDTEFEVYEVNVTEEDVKAVIEEEVN